MCESPRDTKADNPLQAADVQLHLREQDCDDLSRSISKRKQKEGKVSNMPPVMLSTQITVSSKTSAHSVFHIVLKEMHKWNF